MNIDLRNTMCLSKKLVVPCCKTYEFISINEIIRCEGLQNYCRVYLKSGEILVSTKSLGHFENTLKDFGFVKCHRSHLINKDHVAKYHKEGSVELVDQSSVPVSRRMREDLLKYFFEHFIN